MTYSRSDRLSPGARARLREYSAQLEERVIAEAKKLNPTDVLTSRDISDAYSLFQTGDRRSFERENAAYGALSQTYRTRSALLAAASAALVALGGLLIVGFTSFRADTGISSPIVTSVSLVVTSSAVFAILLVTVTSARRFRHIQSRALQYAEADSRAPQVAFWVAEALQSRDKSSTEDLDATVQTVRFISLWARLEDRLRNLAREALGMHEETAADYPIGLLLSDLTRLGGLDEVHADEFRRILRIRNSVAHGKPVSLNETSQALDYMEVLEDFLDSNIRHRRHS